jgi:hypothetical protein
MLLASVASILKLWHFLRNTKSWISRERLGRMDRDQSIFVQLAKTHRMVCLTLWQKLSWHWPWGVNDQKWRYRKMVITWSLYYLDTCLKLIMVANILLYLNLSGSRTSMSVLVPFWSFLVKIDIFFDTFGETSITSKPDMFWHKLDWTKCRSWCDLSMF